MAVYYVSEAFGSAYNALDMDKKYYLCGTKLGARKDFKCSVTAIRFLDPPLWLAISVMLFRLNPSCKSLFDHSTTTFTVFADDFLTMILSIIVSVNSSNWSCG